jgi:hypothetical protein
MEIRKRMPHGVVHVSGLEWTPIKDQDGHPSGHEFEEGRAGEQLVAVRCARCHRTPLSLLRSSRIGEGMVPCDGEPRQPELEIES